MILNPYALAVAGGGYDADAEAFFTARSITDVGQKDAVNALVLSFKANGIWAKCAAIYPFVGGTAASHAGNLKSPGTYDITWSGTVTHSANGVQSDGTTGYGNTGANPFTVMGSHNGHLAIYSRTHATGTKYDIACWNSVRFTGINANDGLYMHSPNWQSALPPSNPSTAAMYVGSRTSATSVALYRNGVAGTNGTDFNSTTWPAGPDNANIGIMALLHSVNPPSAFSNRQLALVSFGDGLTSAEAGDYYTAVQAYQTALGRQV